VEYGNRYQCNVCEYFFRDVDYANRTCPICGSSDVRIVKKDVRID